ncbi:MAG: TetR/AcrR family transcriptional regulator [Bacillota bacterium]
MFDGSRNYSHRKNEFLMTALELFYKKGYENTTIKDIIDELGVSKGAFYHYFASKEDVIVALAKEFTERAVRIISEIFKRPDLSAVEKMNKVFEAISEHKIREREHHSKFKASLESEDNLKLKHEIVFFMKQDVLEFYKKLIDSGYEEGIFGHPVNSREMAEFFINTIFTLNTSVHELEKELDNDEMEADYQELLNKLDEKVRFYEVMLERVLQLRSGNLDLRTPYLRRFKREK